MTGQSGAARRYARALHDVARDGGDPQVVAAELSALAELLLAQRALRTLLANPALPSKAKLGVVAALAERAGWSPLTRRLLALVVERGRGELLPEIVRQYRARWNAARGVLEVELLSAVELDAEQRRALEAAIRQATGQSAELRASLEPALLGGVVLRMGGRTYDGSVRSRLAGLRRRLSGATAG